MSRWPNFFIAGAPRCGTSSLHAWLPLVPGLFLSRIKEPNYFSRSVIGDLHPMVKPIRNEAEYLRLFGGAGDARIVGEATPFYLQDPDAPAQIRLKSPDAKVLVSLRDPVERLYSHYFMMRNNLQAMGSFMEEIERGLALHRERDLAILDPATGLYSQQIERYRRVFGTDRFKAIVLEEWSQDVPATIASICEFLELGPVVVGTSALPQRRYSEARGPVVRFLFGNRKISRATEALIPYRLRKFIRNTAMMKNSPKPSMDPEARKFLVNYYRDDVQRTQQLLGRSLPWPNFRHQPPLLRPGRTAKSHARAIDAPG